MPRTALLLTAPLLLSVALAGCSGSSSDAGDVPATASPAASDPAAVSPAAQPSTEATSAASSPAAQGSGTGTITFTGALSGTMTVAVCHDGMAQLVVAVDGADQTYNGLIDADDFTFAVPHSTGYTLADGTSKPQVSGKTYTVKGTKLVSITNDDTVTANGSVTCP